MELLLRIAGFARWQILGVFDRRPLLHETDAMIVQAGLLSMRRRKHDEAT